MRTIAIWIQAISALAVVALTIWVIFYSGAGDLAMRLLRSELLVTIEQKRELERQKKKLQDQKKQLQNERNKLAKDREEHIIHVVNAHLHEIWKVGIKILSTHRNIAKLGQELLKDAKNVELYKNWKRGQKKPKASWYRWDKYLTFPSQVVYEKRNKWGELILDWSGVWKCSKDISDVINLEIDMTAYQLKCFHEWELAFRERIEIIGGQGEAQTLWDFSEQLLSWPSIKNASEEVRNRIRSKLIIKLSDDQSLKTLPIQLRVVEGVSIGEIAEEAKQIKANIERARDWLDEATKERKYWEKTIKYEKGKS